MTVSGFHSWLWLLSSFLQLIQNLECSGDDQSYQVLVAHMGDLDSAACSLDWFQLFSLEEKAVS